MRRKSLPEEFSQNRKLPIRIVSDDFGGVSREEALRYDATKPLPYFFFVLVVDGTASYTVDHNRYELGRGELLFCLPGQIQHAFPKTPGTVYYKLGFDEECLSKLPKQYTFLLNPLNRQKLSCDGKTAIRLQAIFGMLLELLRLPDGDPEIILAHLHSLLTEVNALYFTASDRIPGNARLDTFLGFKLFVEDNLTEHPAIGDIAEALAVSTDSLYNIVKEFSDLSPKAFITNRLILEARRRIRHGQRPSVKELAFELGFNDPDYFSRLFKKVTGKTVAAFFRDLS